MQQVTNPSCLFSFLENESLKRIKPEATHQGPGKKLADTGGGTDLTLRLWGWLWGTVWAPWV